MFAGASFIQEYRQEELDYLQVGNRSVFVAPKRWVCDESVVHLCHAEYSSAEHTHPTEWQRCFFVLTACESVNALSDSNCYSHVCPASYNRVLKKIFASRQATSQFDLLSYALSLAYPAHVRPAATLAMEFGVNKGHTIRHIASVIAQNHTVSANVMMLIWQRCIYSTWCMTGARLRLFPGAPK